MKPMSGENSHRSHDRDEVFADAPERHQKLDSDEELEAALYQELIEISGCTQPWRSPSLLLPVPWSRSG
jgi:hypothetical protein